MATFYLMEEGYLPFGIQNSIGNKKRIYFFLNNSLGELIFLNYNLHKLVNIHNQL